jgi:Holliday junction resolvasome RuvABC DNA-binding subunit
MTTLIDETYWKQQRDSLKNICPLSEQALLSSFPGLSQKSAEIIVMSLGWDYH